MNILVIANCDPLEYLGSGYVINRFAEGLRARGHQVDVYGPEKLPVSTWLGKAGYQYKLAWAMRKGLQSILAQQPEHYQVIEFYGGESTLAMRWLLRQQGRPIMVHHTNGPETKYLQLRENLLQEHTGAPWQRKLKSRFLAPSFLLPDGIVTVSQDDEDWLKAHGLPHTGRVQAILPALPDEYLKQAVPSWGKRPKVIGFCGTWLPKKGIAMMQADLPPILAQNPDWTFRIIGAKPDFAPGNYFPQEVLAQIEVVPFLKSKEELMAQYQTLRILIVPSMIESFGLVIAEAMSAGALVLATKVGLATSLTDGQEAIIIQEKQSPYLRLALEKAMESSEQSGTIALQGYQFINQLTWARGAELLENFYRELRANL